MSQSLTLNVPDDVFATLNREARAAGVSVQDWVVDILSLQLNRKVERPAAGVQRADAVTDLLQHLGTVAFGDPEDADNEAIDRDLAREYESTHEAE